MYRLAEMGGVLEPGRTVSVSPRSHPDFSCYKCLYARRCCLEIVPMSQSTTISRRTPIPTLTG